MVKGLRRMRNSAGMAVIASAMALSWLPTQGQSISPDAVTPSKSPLVAAVAAVESRTADGKVERFADSQGREFAAHFDAQGRLISVGAIRARHISDVVNIGYFETGQISGVVLASGYSITYTYANDGTQIIRDPYGGILTRRRGSDAEVHSDPTGQLSSLAARLDALLSTLGARTSD
jgi:hypothetical protein